VVVDVRGLWRDKDPVSLGVEEAVIRKMDWFGAGWAVYQEDVRDPEYFPPLGDRDAQRQWLGGFGAAWASDIATKESVDDAISKALEGRAELLRQLRSHTSGKGVRTLH
jgi:hypothetical protein